MGLMRVFDVAGSGMAAQSLRLNVVASNLANAESTSGDPGSVYRARHPVFAVQPFEDGDGALSAGVRVAGVVESRNAPAMRYDPGNPLADSQGRIYSASVSPVEEMADMISASRSYQSNVAVIETARELVLRTIAMGR